MAITMVTLGLWIVLFTAGWVDRLPWVLRLLSTGSLCILLILIATQRRWTHSQSRRASPAAAKSGRNGWSPAHDRANDSRIIQLAAIRYEITDSEEPDTLVAFLDQPLLMRQGTPGQVLENAILAYVKQLESACQGQVTTSVSITRGSLTIALSFVSAYGFIAQYHDFVESLTLLRRQIQSLLHQTSGWYLTARGRELQVKSDVQIESPAAALLRSPGAVQRSRQADESAEPLQINNSVTPAHNDIRIHVATSSLPGWLLTALLAVAMLAQLCIGVTYLAWANTATRAECTEQLGHIMEWLGQIAHHISAFWN